MHNRRLTHSSRPSMRLLIVALPCSSLVTASSIVTAYSRVVWTSLREFTSAVSMLSFARWIASISTRVISTVSSGSSAGLGCDSAFCQRCLDCATQRNLYIGIRTRIWIAANIILNNYNKLQRYRADRYTRHAWQRQHIPLYSARMAAAKHTAILGMRDSGKACRYTRHA